MTDTKPPVDKAYGVLETTVDILMDEAEDKLREANHLIRALNAIKPGAYNEVEVVAKEKK